MKSLRCRFDSEFNAIRHHPTPLVYASPTAMLWAMQAKRNGRIAHSAHNSLRNSLGATLHLAAQPTRSCPARDQRRRDRFRVNLPKAAGL